MPLPDDRLTRLQGWVGVPEAIQTRVDFVDVAGLVKGAHKGEGLGNQFLGRIRHVDAIAHVVRCFDDENVVHVNARPQPADDIAVINTELALADLQQLERRLEKLEREVKGDRKLQPQLEMARQVEAFLAQGEPLRKFPERDQPDFAALDFEMRFLTAKPIIYVANVGEASLNIGNVYLESAREIAAKDGAELIAVCAELEQEIAGLGDEETPGVSRSIRLGREQPGIAHPRELSTAGADQLLYVQREGGAGLDHPPRLDGAASGRRGA